MTPSGAAMAAISESASGNLCLDRCIFIRLSFLSSPLDIIQTSS